MISSRQLRKISTLRTSQLLSQTFDKYKNNLTFYGVDFFIFLTGRRMEEWRHNRFTVWGFAKKKKEKSYNSFFYFPWNTAHALQQLDLSSCIRIGKIKDFRISFTFHFHPRLCWLPDNSLFNFFVKFSLKLLLSNFEFSFVVPIRFL